MPFLAPVLVSLTLAPPTPVNVETARTTDADLSAADQRQLQGWLMLRLVEAGYAIVPTRQQAALTLQIVHRPTSIQVRTDGQTQSHVEVEHGAPALMQLETLHRAIEQLDRAAPRAHLRDDTTPRVVLAVDGEPSSHAPHARTEPAVALALVEAGAALQPIDSPYDTVVCISHQARSTTLRGSSPGQRCDGPELLLPLNADPIDGELLARTTAVWIERTRHPPSQESNPAPTLPQSDLVPPPPELARPEARETSEATPIRSSKQMRSETRRQRPRRSTPAASALPEEVDPARVSTSLRLGAASRSERIDAAAGFAVEFGRQRGYWLAAEVTVQPSQARDIGMTVVETTMGLGAGIRLAIDSAWTLTTLGMAGTKLHYYAVDAADMGRRWDFWVAVPIEVAWSGSRPVELGVALRPALTRGRQHLVGQGTASEREVWASAPWSVGAMFVLRYRWGAE